MIKVWDKTLFIASLVILTAVSVFLGLNAPAVQGDLAALTALTNKQGKPAVPLDPAALQQERESWLDPKLWDVSDKDHQLFVGRKYLYFASENTVKLYEDDLLIDGLQLSWIEKYNLPISDVNIGHRDTDGDGFSNLAEFTAGTDPNDPHSHPAYSTILRLKSYSEKRYRIKFQTRFEVDGVDQFQIATRDGSKSSVVVKKGDVFDGFKVEGYENKTKVPEAPDYVSDVSELQLLNEKSGEHVVLVINNEKDVPEVTGTFILVTAALVNQPVSARVGEEFALTVSLPHDLPPNVCKFKLIKATADSALVLDEGLKKEATIPVFDPKTDLVPLKENP